MVVQKAESLNCFHHHPVSEWCLDSRHENRFVRFKWPFTEFITSRRQNQKLSKQFVMQHIFDLFTKKYPIEHTGFTLNGYVIGELTTISGKTNLFRPDTDTDTITRLFLIFIDGTIQRNQKTTVKFDVDNTSIQILNNPSKKFDLPTKSAT